MKVLHLNYSDTGGTGIAIQRFNKELNNLINCKIYVSNKCTSNQNVETFNDYSFKIGKILRPKISYFFKIFAFDRKFTSTPAILNSRWIKFINNSDYDIINLHWINCEMLSIEEIGKIEKKVCWTFHDMWPFCGGENISFDTRYIHGYPKDKIFRGFDYNAWMWKRKKKNWNNIKHIISPSHNHKKLILNSKLFHNASVEVIYNGIDLDRWRRKNIGITKKNRSDQKVKILYIYSWGKIIKGLDLFLDIILRLNKICEKNFILLLCGDVPKNVLLILKNNKIEYQFYKNITKEKDLIEIYNSADITMISSRAETLPNVGVESLAMDLPIVAFEDTGSVDLIDDQKNGYLVKKFDTVEFAEKINDLVLNSKLRKNFSEASKLKKKNFCIKKNSEKYISFYKGL